MDVWSHKIEPGLNKERENKRYMGKGGLVDTSLPE